MRQREITGIVRAFETSRATPSEATSSEIVPSTGDCVFKHLSLLGAFLIQATTRSKVRYGFSPEDQAKEQSGWMIVDTSWTASHTYLRDLPSWSIKALLHFPCVREVPTQDLGLGDLLSPAVGKYLSPCAYRLGSSWA